MPDHLTNVLRSLWVIGVAACAAPSPPPVAATAGDEGPSGDARLEPLAHAGEPAPEGDTDPTLDGPADPIAAATGANAEAQTEPRAEVTSAALEVEPELIARLARGELELASLIDRRRGLLLVEYHSRSSPVARRLCGQALDVYLAGLQDDLRVRIEDHGARWPIRCDGQTCTFPAEQEWDSDGRLTFRIGSSGLILDSTVRIEGGPISEEFIAEGEAFAARRLRQLARGSCR